MKRIKKLQEQKGKLQIANQQLNSYSKEITVINKELDQSIKQINKLD